MYVNSRKFAGQLLRLCWSALFALWMLAALESHAAIVVDPNSTGATDVRYGSGAGVPLTNPVTDPFNGGSTIFVGRTGVGALAVTGGSQVSSTSTHVASFQGTQGTLLLDGPGTKWKNTADFRVGTRGVGKVDVLGGALLETSQGWIGSGSTPQTGHGTLRVAGTGSRWDVQSYFFHVGDYFGSQGELIVADGGLVELNTAGGSLALDSFFVRNFEELGRLSVAGVGSEFRKTGPMGMALGDHWTYNLEVAQGGLVDIAGDLIVDQAPGATSLIRLDAGTIDVQGLWVDPARLTGNGTIYAGGLVTDMDLVFDATHPLQQQLLLNTLPGQNVTIDLDTTQPGSLGVGHYGSGTLLIADGRQVVTAGWGMLGNQNGASGVATVTGLGSQWEITKNLNVGYQGVGVLNVEDNASVEVAEDVYIDQHGAGAGSGIHFDNGTLQAGALFSTGADLSGTGTVNAMGLVSDLGLVIDQTTGLQQQILLNSQPGQNVTLNLDLSAGGTLGAGYHGQGSLTIAAGVQVFSDRGYVGYHTGAQGEVTVTGSQSQWVIADELHIGSSGLQGVGRATVADGGRLTHWGSIEAANASELIVTDPNSVLEAQYLYLNDGSSLEVAAGGRAHTSVYLSQGAAVTVHGAGSTLSAHNELTLNDSTFTVDSGATVELEHTDLRIESASQFELAGGTLDMGGGDVLLSSNSQFVFSGGTLSNLGTFDGTELDIGGTLQLRSSQQTPVVDGNLIMAPGGTLQVILDGDFPAGDLMLRVDGTASLSGGTLQVLLDDQSPYVPALGHGFRILDAQGDLGDEQFDDVSLPDLPPELKWNLYYGLPFDTTQVLLAVVPTLAADFNADGTVDGDDLETWDNSYGNEFPIPYLFGDADGDHDVDGTDFLVWQTQFGLTLTSPLAVPEPASATLIALASLVMFNRRGRRERRGYIYK